MTTENEPERVRWAVAALEVRPDDTLLELGCGGGAAVSLVCALLEEGTVTAIDRSPLQIERAERRNAEHVSAGRARFLVADLESAVFPERSFDTIFAINVNHFWTQPESAAPGRLARMLKRGGTLSLLYETPATERAASIEPVLVDSLARAPFVDVTSTISPFLHVTARAP